MAFQLTQTTIRVEGNDEDIIFSNLVINQHLADINSFHFTWRQPEGESSLSAHVSFYTDNLSKEVTITIGGNFTFKGIIFAINCNNQDTLGVSYDITGKGLFARLDQVQECNSFYKKTLSQVFDAVNHTQGTTLNLSPSNTSEMFYTVQYNQTAFAFLRMLAVRYGEWFFYTGTEMQLGPPTGEAITLVQGEDVYHVDIAAKLVRASQNMRAFDRFTGEEISSQPSGNSSGGGFLAAAIDAGDQAFGSNQAITHFPGAANADILTDMGNLNQKAAAASAVVLRASSSNSTLKLGSKIKLEDAAGGNAGEYYITEVHHTCPTDSSYQNQIVAVPAEVEVPPYTNTLVVAFCKSQPAVVTDNEDKDGQDRIKVHFPWQANGENSPWLHVVTPHAGKDKGIRFLPEVGEEVMVDFLDNNAEKPFVLGAIHTEKNKSGDDYKSNNIKVIGSKTGRRLEINDEVGYVGIADNYKGKFPKNIIQFLRNDKDGTSASLSSYNDADNCSFIMMNNQENLFITLLSGGSEILSIKLEKSDQKLSIISKGSINLTADKEINLSAATININASQELKLEGKAKGASLTGMKIAVEADTEMKVKGLNTTVEGSVKADFKAGAMASLTGALVKIN